jgi:hypothetical protein
VSRFALLLRGVAGFALLVALVPGCREGHKTNLLKRGTAAAEQPTTAPTAAPGVTTSKATARTP